MDHVDRYLLYHEPPYYYTDHMWICSFFAAVRDDIEDAIVRRKRAKERAAERKAARERAKTEAEAEAMKTPEPEAAEEKVSAEKATETTMENVTPDNATEKIIAGNSGKTNGTTAHSSLHSKITHLCGTLFKFGSAKRKTGILATQ